MPKSNKHLKEELKRREKMNAEMAKQIKKNEQVIESVKKKIADSLDKN